jgi:hypothetical protein
MALHTPPPKPTELQRFTGYLVLELENRLDLICVEPNEMHPEDAIALVLSAIVAARKEMGW